MKLFTRCFAALCTGAGALLNQPPPRRDPVLETVPTTDDHHVRRHAPPAEPLQKARPVPAVGTEFSMFLGTMTSKEPDYTPIEIRTAEEKMAAAEAKRERRARAKAERAR